MSEDFFLRVAFHEPFSGTRFWFLVVVVGSVFFGCYFATVSVLLCGFVCSPKLSEQKQFTKFGFLVRSLRSCDDSRRRCCSRVVATLVFLL